MLNRSIKDALAFEEKFFRSHPVYNGLADRCGIPQLAKKLNQILVRHIRTVLPGLKSRISSSLVSVAKEHASYGEITESKAGQGALLLNILSKYSEGDFLVSALSSMVEGKNEEMSTSELSGGARIHYIFQSIFVKSLEEVDPCEDLTDDDIRTAIQNATGTKSALFVPEVPFEVLIRRQIARLLDPSLQCARFIYDELIKMSHCCLVSDLQRFPVLRKRMDEVTGNFLREGLEPSETMIGHIIEMEMDYINTSHPNFIGGSKAVEVALQQTKSSKISVPMHRLKDGVEPDNVPTSGKSLKSRAIFARSPANGIGADQPPTILRPSETHSEQETIEIAVTKLLLRSYYDIVRKNIEDSVPKAIMHFLVSILYIWSNKLLDNLFEEMLKEPDEVALKRKRTRETLRVLQQAFRVSVLLLLESSTEDVYHSCSNMLLLAYIRLWMNCRLKLKQLRRVTFWVLIQLGCRRSMGFPRRLYWGSYNHRYRQMQIPTEVGHHSMSGFYPAVDEKAFETATSDQNPDGNKAPCAFGCSLSLFCSRCLDLTPSGAASVGSVDIFC
ncbi:hypothetical protein HHK36_030777 [Tetracentron sinense]|uniref:GED domain-containing protein n=1 Tax=Tetracentron sinense TaxID=13715 RepID=A0A834YD97_TETSI|nr:hypothetical protein HHK36_030777 [Tetracentron sinense]